LQARAVSIAYSWKPAVAKVVAPPIDKLAGLEYKCKRFRLLML
jgi:hypothetical protein